MDRSSHSHVLLVESSAAQAGLIKARLHQGLGDVQVLRVDRLSSALEAINHQQFSVVLLDLDLPDSSGVETFRRICARANGIPIVVLSEAADPDTAQEALSAGADDYVAKQNSDADTLSRSVRFAVERSERRTAERELLSARSELVAAQNVQDSLYPKEAPDIPGLDVAAGIRSAGIGCGDYYDFIPLRDGSFMFVVGDVSGHGMASALVMAETRACLRALADVQVPTSVMLPAMNRLIYAGTSEAMFVTLLLVSFNPRSGEFWYFNSGHPAWLLTGSSRRQLDTHLQPLGVLSEVESCFGETFRMRSGDVLTIPTDGIMETCRGEEIFGKHRLLQIVEDHRSSPSATIVDHVFEAAKQFSTDDRPDDDMTIVVIRKE